MNKLNSWAGTFLKSPLVWGGLAAALYYGAIQGGVIDQPLLLRFTAGHFVEYIVTVAFFVGLAALGVKAVEVLSQRFDPRDSLLGPAPEGGQPVADAGALLAQLDAAPAHLRSGYLLHRLRGALEHVRRTGSAKTLDDEIKYLADLDSVHSQHGYAFVRVIIWAIPILGLLGTVIGMTSVFGNLDIKHFDASVPHVVSDMKVAFDTTALALAMSMTLMFVQYFVDRFERTLLNDVDEQVNRELVGRFAVKDDGAAVADPQLAPIRHMIESVVQGTERLVARQTDIWRASIAAADERSGQLAAAGARQLESALAGALRQSLESHATALVAAEGQRAEQNQRHWAGVQQALVQMADASARQQAELARQSEVLLKVVEASGHVMQLEQALNRNLTALAGARNFDETLVALAAAVQLLSARLGQGPGDARTVNLGAKQPRRADQAA